MKYTLHSLIVLLFPISLLYVPGNLTASPPDVKEIETDLLIVGGTESGCAAAVQAARMGVKKITIVNDIAWLGGQFAAESLVAIDENRGPAGYDQTVPFPRNGMFKEIIDRIEAINVKKYGVARPGNTRVITTCRPADAEQAFRDLLSPYVKSGQIRIFSHFEPVGVDVEKNTVVAVRFESRKKEQPLLVHAKLTIDASDWGDVIRLSGAGYEFGPDLKSKYHEPLAPEKREDYPITDMNPITYNMVIEETDEYEPIPKPANYDPRNYRQHKWPNDPLWLYKSRRLIDHYHYKQIKHPDVLLLCFPAFDYPLDVHPQAVAQALEATEKGASKKNIVQLSPAQRRIVFEDAKQYSLGFLYYLQTEVHDKMKEADKVHSFRRFALTKEFGTPDRMPFKPYVRESLRLHAMYMMRQQDTTGVGGNAHHFARAMYHDGVAAWQFEYDFHPTKREFLDKGDPAGPWRCVFRKNRTWGPPYSGRSLFPLRSLVPQKLDGLLGAQKNLGYSSIVSSAVRLHDQSMVIGQVGGAAAAIALKYHVQPREIPFDRDKLIEVQTALAGRLDGGIPSCLWPYQDVQPSHPAFTAINMLAVQKCLPQLADDVRFRPDGKPSEQWMMSVIQKTREQVSFIKKIDPPMKAKTRGEFAQLWWKQVQTASWKPYVIKSSTDADKDGIPDVDDALPLDAANASLPMTPIAPESDGLPGNLPNGYVLIKQFNFCGKKSPKVKNFLADHGRKFDDKLGHGWKRDISKNNRQRGKTQPVADTFLFTRSHDVWECALPNGEYRITLCIGDSGHEQFGQNVTVEGKSVFRDKRTAAGRFAERSMDVEVKDGRLTVEIGLPNGNTNTCINWLRIEQKQ